LVNRIAKLFFIAIGIIIVISSFHQFWVRNILAYAVAIALVIWGDWAYKDHDKEQRRDHESRTHKIVNAILWGSKRSYCAFLIHFSFVLLANTLYIAWGMDQRHEGVMAIALMLVSIAGSWIAANFLYRWVEVPSRSLKL
jgi:peptidoglycan/LPS O-acetylase OafA/YrhL